MTNTVFSVHLDELQNRQSMKWQQYPSDVLPLWVAEMDCRPAPAVVEVLHSAIAGETGYPAGTPYEEAYAEFAADHWDWTFDPHKQAIIVPDVMQGIVAVLDHLAIPGPVVVNPPVYPQFYKYIDWSGRNVLEVPLSEEGRLDLVGLERAFAGKAGAKPGAYLLCNPHNPHGTVFTGEELTQAAALAKEHGVRIISDEIHAPLVSAPARFTPILAVDGTEDAVIVTSASKSWNLAGLKAALAIGGNGVADELRTMPDGVTHSASHLGILTHVAALRHDREWLATTLTEIEANRQLLQDQLAEHLPEVHYRRGPATYLAWLDCRDLKIDDPYHAFLKAKVALNNGLAFGTGGAGHVRMNLATSPAIITEAVRRMATALPGGRIRDTPVTPTTNVSRGKTRVDE